MKNILFLLFVAINYLLSAQKYDNNWLFGYGGQLGFPYGNSIMNFDTSPPQISYQNLLFNFRSANACMSDSLGNLLFYTNGIDVRNKNHQMMENGDTLVYCEAVLVYTFGLANSQGVMIIPKPGSKDKYLLFLHFMDAYPDVWLSPTHWYVSEIDMSYNNGLGKVVKKSQIILSDTMANGQNAVKHANGRDWWILTPIYQKNYYHLFLVTPDSIIDKGIQTVPFTQDYALSVFSPDGKYFVSTEGYNDVRIYDFDRCNGQLRLKEGFSMPNFNGGGCSISPNSRYLYYSTSSPSYQRKLYQYDLWADTIQNTQIEVADGTADTLVFGLQQLAPDGKIYSSYSNYIQIIHEPDKQGLACNVEIKAITLPSKNGNSLPFFPHYRLGVEVGSDCDTLGTVGIAQPQASNIKVYPNPAQDVLTIEIPTIKGNFTCIIYNILGQKASEMQIKQTSTKIFVGNWAKGAYFYEISTNNHKEYGKFFIE